MNGPKEAPILSGLPALVNAFPNQIFCSEFNWSSSDSRNASLGAGDSVNAMRELYAYLKTTLSLPRIMVFQWVGYLNGTINSPW